MTIPKSPQRWAFDLTHILNALGGDDRFPVKVKSLAKDYSQQLFPNDPVSVVKGKSLDGFEGGLYKAPPGKTGWGIFYNTAITSPGRINFTIAHELGHYLVHRHQFPDGIECSSEDLARWGSTYGQVEHQANEFAATLLMPRDDFTKQIDPKGKPGFEELGACSARYRVSLMAATLRWLQFTERRALFVVSIDGFILWARSSDKALRSGAYIKTANVPPVPLNVSSLAARSNELKGGRENADHDPFVWLSESCHEETLAANSYGQTYSLLHLEAAPAYRPQELDEEDDEDTYDRMLNRTPGSSWLG